LSDKAAVTAAKNSFQTAISLVSQEKSNRFKEITCNAAFSDSDICNLNIQINTNDIPPPINLMSGRARCEKYKIKSYYRGFRRNKKNGYRISRSD
jgi:hypothetical protein